jgi:predicted dehydrogenase
MSRNYVIVGLGHRAYTFLQALLGTHAAYGNLVGLCDVNPGRLAHAATIAAGSGVNVPTYEADDFDRMLRETTPERVIVTVPDYLHCSYIVRSLQFGADVITEKPLTIDAESCRRIVAARQASGRSVTVAFNYRYSPVRSLLKRVLISGIIGHVTAVNFEWQLDTHHGADYFRRWHRNKAHSGGLLVHKATHHFDLLNWWLGSVPRRVTAHGRRVFYRPEAADALGLDDRGERCSACPAFARCRVRLDIASNDHLRTLYSENERHDGYFRDCCVFSATIDIEDTMHVVLEFENGAITNYMLTTYGPSEGYRVVFHGTRGKLVLETVERSHVRANGSLISPPLQEHSRIVVQPLFSHAYVLPLPETEGLHGGGDRIMLDHLFRDGLDATGLAADERAGAWSALTGIAANASLASRTSICLDELSAGISPPDIPPEPFGPTMPWQSFHPDRYSFLAGAKMLSDRP